MLWIQHGRVIVSNQWSIPTLKSCIKNHYETVPAFDNFYSKRGYNQVCFRISSRMFRCRKITNDAKNNAWRRLQGEIYLKCSFYLKIPARKFQIFFLNYENSKKPHKYTWKETKRRVTEVTRIMRGEMTRSFKPSGKKSLKQIGENEKRMMTSSEFRLETIWILGSWKLY